MPKRLFQGWGGSLMLRLFGGTALWIAIALGLTTFALDSLFKDQATRQFEQQLQSYLYQIVASLELDAQGNPIIPNTGGDPRFNRPESGLYWQINDNNGATLLKSRSLWDTKLNVANDRLLKDEIHFHSLTGPAEQRLLIAEHNLVLPDPSNKQLRVIVGSETKELARAIETWQHSLGLFVGILFVSLVVAAIAQVAFGLQPLRQLQQSLKKLREGDNARIMGKFPTELKPLIDDFNAVIDANGKIIERARNQAGDLAHSIKTPISVMINALQAERLRSSDNAALIAALEEQLKQLQQQVQWRLKRARIAANVGVPHSRTLVGTTLKQLTRVMQKVHADKSIHVDMGVMADELYFAGEEQDLQEIVGNLLDNAFKWAISTVAIHASYTEGNVIIVIEDDGPGCTSLTDHIHVPSRGERADESVPGSGLGLSIVRDLVTLYDGTLSFESKSPQGLRIVTVLPGGLTQSPP
jgi:signal transduction histidine kinase